MDPGSDRSSRPADDRTARLSALLELLGSVAGAATVDGVLDEAAAAASRCCDSRGAAIALFDGPDAVDALAIVGRDLTADARERVALLERVRAGSAPRRDGAGDLAFLGVPVVIGGASAGALYVTGRARGPFDEQDELVLAVLARAVATAAVNVRLHGELRAQQRWLTATAEIGSQLLAHTGEDPLRLVARRAFELSDADLVVVALVTEDQSAIVIEEAVGGEASDIVGRRYPLPETMAGLAVVEQRAILADAGGDVGFGYHSANLNSVINVGPVMVLPLIGTQRVRGSMTVSRVRGATPYTETDLTLAAGFATHASVALELADSRVAEQRVVLLEDRDRIARDLHDHVIQELFAIGLSLQSIATQIGLESDAGDRLGQRVEDLDRTIRRIRTSIFELRGPLGAGHGDGLRQSALEIAGDLAPALGFAPNVGFSGPVDLAVDPELTADVIAVIREALTNVAKHAHATRVALDVDLPSGEVVVTVRDDGVGPGTSARSSGIANLRTRAERRGGTLDVTPASTGGTLLVWRAPIRDTQ